MTDKDRLLTDDTVKTRRVVEFASGKGRCIMTLLSSEDSGHDFIVKFGPSVCVAVELPRQETWLYEVAYHAHGTNTAVIHGYDKTLNQQCMLAAQARPSMIIILLVYL